MIARAADGSMRDALSASPTRCWRWATASAHAPSASATRSASCAEDEYLAVLDIIADRRAGDVFAFDRSGSATPGIDFGMFLTGLADMLRAQLAVVLGSSSAEVTERARAALEARRDRGLPGDLLRMLTAIGELEPRFRKSGQQQLLLEALLVRFALLDRTVASRTCCAGSVTAGSGQ